MYGNPLERVLWFILVAVMTSLAIYLGVVYFTKYSIRDVRIERRVSDINELTIPVITVCDSIRDKIACFNNKTLLSEERYRARSCGEPIKFDAGFHEICPNCFDKLAPECITLNLNGTKKQHLKNQRVELGTLFSRSDHSRVTIYIGEIHNDVIYHSILPLDGSILTFKNVWFIEIKQKTYINRLPIPFPSKCKTNNEIENFFATSYSQQSCIQSCFMREMFTDCGAVIDRWQPFVTIEMKKKTKKKLNITECLSYHLSRFLKYVIPAGCNCPVACEEVDFEIELTPFFEGDDHALHLFAYYRSMEEVSEKEIPQYTLIDYIAEMGGLVGVLAGMSAISVVEVLVYCLLHIMIAFIR